MAEPDAVAVRIVARLRVGIAIGVATTGSFLPHGSSRQATLFLVVGLVWIPWASVVLLAADRAGGYVATVGGPVGDILLIFALQSLAPSSGPATLLGVAAVVAFAAYTGGRPLGVTLAAGALLATLLAQHNAPASQRLETSSVTFLAVTLAALVLLLDRTSSIQRHTAARSARLEGKSDAILARVADGVVVTDAVGHILQCNRSAEQIMGLDESAALGARCNELLALHIGERPLDCTGGCALLAMSTSPGAALGQEVWRLSGSRRQPLLANASAVTDADATILEVVHSLRDITRIKQADEAKTIFLATASHELKTPLTVIGGFAELMLAEELEPDVRHSALTAIHGRARELTKIVDRLLLSSRIEAGHVDVSLAEIEVGPLLVERAKTLEAATGRTMIVEVSNDLPAAVGDTAALATVVDHLLENAIKYSPGREPIRLSTAYDEDVVQIEIADQGIGMDAEQITHCFEKFWQAEATDVRRFGGTGIGLYIVGSLVEAMRGHLDVDSRIGEGTRFRVALPRQAAEAAEPAAAGDRTDELMGERSSIREFMRQIGVPERGEP